MYDALWGSQIDISNTNFDSNSATNKADVFYSKNNRPVSFQDSQLTNNTLEDSANVSFDGELPDIAYGSNSSETISGTLNSQDIIKGNGGNEDLNGGASNDLLLG